MRSNRGRSEARSCRVVSSCLVFAVILSSRRFGDERVVARVRSHARKFAGNDVPAPALGSVDRGRLDSVTLSIWPCVFGDGSARQRPGVTRVFFERRHSDERRKWGAFFENAARGEIRDARARVRRGVRFGVPARPRVAPICRA